MNTLMERINKEIEEKAMKFGIMGTEPVNITLELSEEEKAEFWKINLNNHYSYNLEGNELSITYVETIKTTRDNRKWIEVHPRGFANEYYFIAIDKEKSENFLSKINNDVNSTAYIIRKSKVENSDCFSYDKEKNYWILDEQKVEDKKQGR